MLNISTSTAHSNDGDGDGLVDLTHSDHTDVDLSDLDDLEDKEAFRPSLATKGGLRNLQTQRMNLAQKAVNMEATKLIREENAPQPTKSVAAQNKERKAKAAARRRDRDAAPKAERKAAGTSAVTMVDKTIFVPGSY